MAEEDYIGKLFAQTEKPVATPSALPEKDYIGDLFAKTEPQAPVQPVIPEQDFVGSILSQAPQPTGISTLPPDQQKSIGLAPDRALSIVPKTTSYSDYVAKVRKGAQEGLPGYKERFDAILKAKETERQAGVLQGEAAVTLQKTAPIQQQAQSTLAGATFGLSDMAMEKAKRSMGIEEGLNQQYTAYGSTADAIVNGLGTLAGGLLTGKAISDKIPKMSGLKGFILPTLGIATIQGVGNAISNLTLGRTDAKNAALDVGNNIVSALVGRVAGLKIPAGKLNAVGQVATDFVYDLLSDGVIRGRIKENGFGEWLATEIPMVVASIVGAGTDYADPKFKQQQKQFNTELTNLVKSRAASISPEEMARETETATLPREISPSSKNEGQAPSATDATALEALPARAADITNEQSITKDGATISETPYTKEVVHVTTPESASAIRSHGFDVNRGKGIGGDDYGPGIYMADNASDMGSFWKNELATKESKGNVPTTSLQGTVKLTQPFKYEYNRYNSVGDIIGKKSPRESLAEQRPDLLDKYDVIRKQPNQTDRKAFGQTLKESGYDGLVVEHRQGDEVIAFDKKSVEWKAASASKPKPAPAAAEKPQRIESPIDVEAASLEKQLTQRMEEGRTRVGDLGQEMADKRPYNEIYKEAQALGVAEGAKDKSAVAQRVREAKAATEITGNPEKDSSLARDVVSPQGEIVESRVGTKTVASPETPPEVKIALEDAGATEHRRLKNKDLVAYANDLIAKNPIEAHRRVMETPYSPENVALASKLRDQARSAGNGDLEFQITERMNNLGISSGRIVQALKLWYRGLSPDGFMAMVRSDAKRKGYSLSPEQEGTIRTAKDALDKMPEGEAKDQARRSLLQQVVSFTPKWKQAVDWLTAYRYSNALSSPRSTLRNLTGNIIQTFVTRPTSLLGQGKIKDAFSWWNDIGNQWGKGFENFMTAMKDTDIGKWQDNLPSGELEAARQQRIPFILRAIPQFMNAQDKFFSTFIAAGEKTRLMREGMSEQTATAMADKLSEKYLFREDLTKSQNDYNPAVTRGINSLGLIFQKMNEVPVLGQISKPFLMFIRTPTNVAKFAIESSPFGVSKRFPKLTPEQLAKETPDARATRLEREYMHNDQVGRAIFGSLITAIGGAMAMAGNTTWAAPQNPELKELWYATGRKPYSVKIGEKWVPLWYFGPYAIALGIPAAVADMFRDNPNKVDKNTTEKLKGVANGIARFIGSQTSMQGANNVFSLLSGKEDMSLEKALGFAGSQVIPASGLLRYINSILDPKFRKSTSFTETIRKDIPGMSKDLEAYVDPSGKPAERVLSDWFAPYTIGTQEKKYEARFQGVAESVGREQRGNKILREKESEAKKRMLQRKAQ